MVEGQRHKSFFKVMPYSIGALYNEVPVRQTFDGTVIFCLAG
jgi:hypothetical protein